MKNVCVITGGGSGMGFAAAKEELGYAIATVADERNGYLAVLTYW